MAEGSVRYGTFDHRFFGVTMEFTSAEDLDFFVGLYDHSITPEFLQEERRRGVVSEHRLWLGTALEHEYRHFHDGLLSPHWLTMLNLRHQNIINTAGLQALVVECAPHGNCLPLPLRKWFRLDVAARKRRIGSWSARIGESEERWAPIPLPVLDDAEGLLRKLASAAFWPALPSDLIAIEGKGVGLAATSIMGYDRIDALLQGRQYSPDTRFCPRDAYEFSALLVQLVSANRTFDDKAADDLRRSVQTRGALDYGNMLIAGFVCLMSSPGLKMESMLRVGAAAAAWALFGPPDLINDRQGRERSSREIDFSCPGYRLGYALRLISETRLRSTKPIDVLSFLDASSGTLPMDDALDWAALTMKNREKQLGQLMVDDNGYRHVIEPLHAVVGTINRRRDRLLSQFREDPDSYLDPVAYLAAGETYDPPSLRVETNFNHPLMVFDTKVDPRDQGVFRWTQEPDGKFWARSAIISYKDEIAPRLLFEYEMRHLETDFFNTGKVFMKDVEFFRRGLEQELELKVFMV